MWVSMNERFNALVLLAMAALGVVLANSPISVVFFTIRNFEVPGLPHHMTTAEFISEFALLFFFLIIGIELRHEFKDGIFSNPKSAGAPALAAGLGVVVPALAFIAVVGTQSEYFAGWPIPTATDVTFSLAIFSLFGSRLPRTARAFLLAVVVIDDILAILIIAIVYAGDFKVANFMQAIVCSAVLWITLRFASLVRNRILRILLMLIAISAATLAWYQLLESGIHPSIIGVSFAFLLPSVWVTKTEKIVTPPVNLIVLPLFAIFSTGVVISTTEVFSSLTLALLTAPIAKLVGITLGGWLGFKIFYQGKAPLSISELTRISALGGIGFTVALLVAQLSFPGSQIADAATVGVLITTVVAMVFGALALSLGHSAKATDRA